MSLTFKVVWGHWAGMILEVTGYGALIILTNFTDLVDDWPIKKDDWPTKKVP